MSMTDRCRRALLRSVGQLAQLAHLCGAAGPDVLTVTRAFDGRTTLRPRRLAAAITASNWRYRALRRFAHTHGLDAIGGMLEGSDHFAEVLARHPRAVLITWHIGPTVAIPAALSRAGIRSFVIRRQTGYTLPAGSEVRPTLDNFGQAAGALLRAVAWLRNPGVVLIAADGGGTARLPAVPCLGAALRFSRGPFFLASRLGVPLIPVLASWGTRPDTLRLHVEAPLEGTGCSGEVLERELARQAGRCLERHVLARPHDLSISLLTWLATASPSRSAGTGSVTPMRSACSRVPR